MDPNRRRRLVLTVVAVVVVGAVYAYALPRFANYSAVWRETRTISPFWGGALALAFVANIVTFAPPWMAVLPGLGFLDAIRMTQASTAVSLVVPGGAPIGMAASFALLRGRRFGAGDVGLAVALTGLWNQGSTFLFPVVAVVLLATQGSASKPLLALTFLGCALAVGIALALVAALWSPAVAERAGDRAARIVSSVRRAFRRGPVGWSGASLAGTRADALAMLRGRWHVLTVATLANQLTGFVLLDFSLRAVGIGRHEISVVESFAAWSLGRLLVSLPITPGGAGVVEVGLVGVLVGFGGGHAAVVAAVLLYRFVSVVPTVVLGAAALASWRFRRPTQ